MASTNPADLTLSRIRSLALGDMVIMPDGVRKTVRSVMLALPHAVGSMHGFVVTGDIGPDTILLSLPADPSTPVGVYRPVENVPPAAANATTVCSGTVPYWPPHLPGLRQAMSELGYKICVIRGHAEPMVLLWRAREVVVFIHSATVDPHSVAVNALTRNESAITGDVTRVAAGVASPDRVGVSQDAQPAGAGAGLYQRFT
jgi:hypothetical protein